MVDDDPCHSELGAGVLRRHGHSVDLAKDSEAAWEELLTNRYNLLVTENDLPGLTGVGLIKKLRSACMPLPVIIAIRTLPSWQSAEYPWLLNAARLFKPYTFEELLGLVRNALPPARRIGPAMAPLPGREERTASLGWRGR